MLLREEMPDIPRIHDPELRDAVKALVSASDALRQLLIMSLDNKASNIEIMTDNRDLILNIDKVIERWLLEFEEDEAIENN